MYKDIKKLSEDKYVDKYCISTDKFPCYPQLKDPLTA